MDDIIGTSIIVPRGVPGLAPSQYDMTEIYRAEGRLREVAFIRPDSAIELQGYFNEITNQTTKYLAWIEYEILQAEKYYGLAKAEVVLDKMPEELKKYKDQGIKSSEAFRDALVARDATCQARQDTLDQLVAVKTLLDNKVKSFVRAYYACQTIIEKRSSAAASPQINGFEGMTYQGVVGKTDPAKFEAMKKARESDGQ